MKRIINLFLVVALCFVVSPSLYAKMIPYTTKTNQELVDFAKVVYPVDLAGWQNLLSAYDSYKNQIQKEFDDIKNALSCPQGGYKNILSLNSKGPEVASIQQFLKDKGYFYGDKTGFFDIRTQQNLYRYQYTNKITSDGYGVFGSSTIKYVNSECGIVSQNIKVISPNGGEKYLQTESININWDSSKLPKGSYVSIDLKPLNSSTISKHIRTSSMNDNSYSWVIPSDVVSGQYVIKVSKSTIDGIVNPSETEVDVSDSPFTIGTSTDNLAFGAKLISKSIRKSYEAQYPGENDEFRYTYTISITAPVNNDVYVRSGSLIINTYCKRDNKLINSSSNLNLGSISVKVPAGQTSVFSSYDQPVYFPGFTGGGTNVPESGDYYVKLDNIVYTIVDGSSSGKSVKDYFSGQDTQLNFIFRYIPSLSMNERDNLMANIAAAIEVLIGRLK